MTGNDLSTITQFKEHLNICFYIKDLGQLKYFLGVKLSCNTSGLYLSQWKYALDIISEKGLSGSKAAFMPIEQNHYLATATSLLCLPQKNITD